MHVLHPLIKEKKIEARLYQETIVASSVEKNSMIVLPTGMGKTIIAAMITAYRLEKYGGKVLFLAPTKPLALQHKKTFEKVLKVEGMMLFTGSTPPEERLKLYKDAKIIFATPQVIENDLMTKKLNLEKFSLVIFDEAHRATGNYAYVYIAEKYQKFGKNKLIIGLTASPGSEEEKLSEVLSNLFIKNVEIRTEDSEDVKPYLQKIDVEWHRVKFPEEFEKARDLLKSVYHQHLEILKNLKLFRKNITKKQLLDLQGRINSRLKKPNPPPYLYLALKTTSLCLKLQHAIDLLETQGVTSLMKYFERLENQKTKSAKELMKDYRVKRAKLLLKNSKVSHPKFLKLKEIVRENKDKKIIVFSHYRDSAAEIVELLNEIEGVKAVRFVGQASRNGDTGLTQKKQKGIIEDFEANKFNCLVATSVAEEGLDIPQVDLVVFYEPVPSEIRAIQRRGRTGRTRRGKVVVLITKETRDETHYYTSRRKEKKMKKMLSEKSLKPVSKQVTLEDFTPKLKIFADTREDSKILKLLSSQCEVEMKNLEVGDYVISERIAVERKTTQDFLKSLIQQKLFLQIRDLKNSYQLPILVVEGENLYSLHKIHPNAIQGALISIMIDFSVPIIFTKCYKETVQFLINLAKREQLKEKREISLRGEKTLMTLSERQQFIVESLPNISSVLAKRLLKQFRTIKKIVNATEEELQQVEGIGKIISKEIKEILEREWEE